MRFANIFTGFALAASAMAAATPQQVVDGIKSITQLSLDLQAPAQSITIVNAPLIVIGGGPFPQLIAGFSKIVITTQTLISQLAVPVARSVPEKVHARDIHLRDTVDPADAVFDAFRDFVRVHQDLLNILIGKAGILTKIPVVGAPVAAALRGVEGVVDTVTIALITLFQTRAEDFEVQGNALGNTLELCINSYAGLQV
ncbi:UVI-1 [Xylaria nigripes]|nr:UVI-1 [Xylaria nigripes]